MAFPRIDHIESSFEVVNPLTDPRWDAWVLEHPGATVFHTAAWARVLAETYRYTPHYIRADDGTLIPLMEIDSWLTGRRGIGLPFSDFCPPIAGSGPELNDANFARVRKLAQQRGWKHLELRGARPIAPDFRPGLTYYTHELDVTDGESAIHARFHPAVRRAIRKAEKSGLTTEIASTAEAMEAYFRLHEITRRRHGLPPQPLSFFRGIHRQILAAGLGFLVLVRLRGRPVAGAIFFHLGDGAMFKFGASDEAHQALRPTNLVLWTAIRRCMELGIRQVHFGRNALFHESLRRFKLSWGTTESQLDYTQFDIAADRFTSVPSLLNGWQNQFFRRLPLPLSRLAGRLLYRHVA